MRLTQVRSHSGQTQRVKLKRKRQWRFCQRMGPYKTMIWIFFKQQIHPNLSMAIIQFDLGTTYFDVATVKCPE
jgi:hypothetical protein